MGFDFANAAALETNLCRRRYASQGKLSAIRIRVTQPGLIRGPEGVLGCSGGRQPTDQLPQQSVSRESGASSIAKGASPWYVNVIPRKPQRGGSRDVRSPRSHARDSLCHNFQEEFLEFLRRHDVQWDERYVWD